MKRFLLIYIIGMFCSYASNAQEQLTLEQCLTSAKTYNRTLQNAALEIQAAHQQRKEVFTNYFPQISANVLAFKAFDKIIKADGIIPEEIVALGAQYAALAGRPYSARELTQGYTTAITAVEPLYVGGKIHTGNKLIKILEDVKVLQQQLKEDSVVQKVTETYWQLAIVKYNKRTIEAGEKQLEAVYKQVELFVNTGVTTRNNLLKVKLANQDLATNRIRLENGERLLRLLLAQEIGMVDKDVDIVLPDENANIQDPEKLHVSALEAVNNRIEYQMAGKGVEAGKLQIKMARADCLPMVAVGVMGYHAGFGGFSEKVQNYVPKNMTNGLVFGTVSVPISAWWGGKHAIQRQKIKYQQSQNDYLYAQDMLCIDIESSYSNLVEAYKQISVAEITAEEAAENLRMSNDMYKVGKETLTDLLDAQTMNRKAQDQLAQAKAVYQIRLAEYLMKIGNSKFKIVTTPNS